MMRTALAICVAASGWLSAQSAPAPPACLDPVHVARQQNSMRLDLSVELDRQEYAPSEVMAVTITLRNGTTQPLEVYEPLQRGSLLIKFANDFESEQAHPEHPRGRQAQDPEGEMRPGQRENLFLCLGTTVLLQPGQALTRSVRLDQPMPWAMSAMQDSFHCAPSGGGGDYLVVVKYRGLQASAPFRVVPIELERHVKLKLRAPGIGQLPDGSTREYEQTVDGFVLSFGGKRYLFIEARSNAFPRVRVAELEPDESLAGLQEDTDGRITARIESGSRSVRYISRSDLEAK